VAHTRVTLLGFFYTFHLKRNTKDGCENRLDVRIKLYKCYWIGNFFKLAIK
jgi:hypothetical protein